MVNKWFGKYLVFFLFLAPLSAEDTGAPAPSPSQILTNSADSLDQLANDWQNQNLMSEELEKRIQALSETLQSEKTLTKEQEILLLKQKELLEKLLLDIQASRMNLKKSLQLSVSLRESLMLSNITWQIGIPVAIGLGFAFGYYMSEAYR